MTFSVQWTTVNGVVSIAQTTALGAYRQAERATQSGMRNVRIRSPDGDLIKLADFRHPFDDAQKN
ncbi:hypothetical protein [Methylorubrum extorquens]|uniref:DUF2188 domain-containing protein n=1 Tax=Methylorubrum extorquens TaxID=408 RepID=A0AAX3WFB7_METEX|nr:hypothetical protein [Methylorubrum extorquens]WHQ70042.1 hypothetical protein KEC54_27670 [Methylorubrum extorquens]